MININIEMVKQLRSATGAGVLECRKALEQGNHNLEDALNLLHAKAAVKAEKQTNREALQGKLELYGHNDGRIGVMVEINTETEFAANSEVFRSFAREVALQITAGQPLYVREEDIPQDVLDEQAQAAAERARQAGKPERIIEKIVQGTLEKYKDKAVLLRQAYIRDESISMAQLLNQTAGHIGENIVIRRFVRWEIGPDPEGE